MSVDCPCPAALGESYKNPANWRVLIDPVGHPFCITNLIPEIG